MPEAGAGLTRRRRRALPNFRTGPPPFRGGGRGKKNEEAKKICKGLTSLKKKRLSR